MTYNTKEILDRLLKAHFNLEPDYREWDGEDEIGLKLSWAYNECFDLKDDSRELHDILKDYVINTGLHEGEYQNDPKLG
jgi:hypothetical protein